MEVHTIRGIFPMMSADEGHGMTHDDPTLADLDAALPGRVVDALCESGRAHNAGRASPPPPRRVRAAPTTDLLPLFHRGANEEESTP